MRKPIILPRDHPLVSLLLCHLHNRRGYCGYKSLIRKAKRKYWIIGLRNMPHCKVRHLQKTLQETIRPAHGTLLDSKSSGRISCFLLHCQRHVWTIADKTEYDRPIHKMCLITINQELKAEFPQPSSQKQ